MFYTYIYISLQCIISLLGYGHQSPLSTSGKVFCMVYALIGIPMTMVLLTAVVERLLIPATALLKWMNTNLGHLHTPFFIRVLHLILVSFRVFIIYKITISYIILKINILLFVGFRSSRLYWDFCFLCLQLFLPP